MQETCLKTKDIAWEEARGYPTGARQKVLYKGSSDAPRAVLLKIDPSWSMQEHSHVYTELHYVLEGSYQTGDEVFAEGTFRIIPRHTNHGPFSTKQGAVILVIWIEEK